MDAHGRLDELFRRLGEAPPAQSAEAAFALLTEMLLEVEDEFSGLPYDPSTPLNDRRMYPPQEDNRIHVSGRPDLRGYRTRRHRVYFGTMGAILVARLDGEMVFTKAGANGEELKL